MADFAKENNVFCQKSLAGIVGISSKVGLITKHTLQADAKHFLGQHLIYVHKLHVQIT